MKVKIILSFVVFITGVISAVAQEAGTFKDPRDKRTYKTIKIGDAVWMAENLAYKTAEGSWAYDKDESNAAAYGYLYTWEAAMTAAPKGWHLATNEEWKALILFFGGRLTAGEKLKTTTGWNENLTATNVSGFSGLPAGKRSKNDNFIEKGGYSYWWTATEYADDKRVASYHGLGSRLSNTIGALEDKLTALSVRCVRDIGVATSIDEYTVNKSAPVAVSTKTYDTKGKYKDGLALVTLKNKYGYVDENNNEVIPPSYQFAMDFSDGMAAVWYLDKFGFIGKDPSNLTEGVPIMYDDVYLGYSNGLAAVKLNNKWGFIDKQGKTIIPFVYDEAMIFMEGLVAVKQNNKWGYLNPAGKMIIPAKYDCGNSFYEGMVLVCVGKKYGYADSTGKEIIPVIYDNTYGYQEGKAHMVLNGESFYFDKMGKVVK